MKNVHIIHVLEEGLLTENKPGVFSTESKAGKFFESEVTAKGFREKHKGEIWADYQKAFGYWEDSSKRTYDKNDWEIAWWADIQLN